MIDVLRLLASREITIEQAQDTFSETIDKFHAGELAGMPQDELGLDRYEWTAVCQGISWAVLAEWRQHGWPTECAHCHKPIDYKKFGWMIRGNQLYCVRCFADG